MKQSYWVTCEIVLDGDPPDGGTLPRRRRNLRALAHAIRMAQLDLDITYVVKNVTITKDKPNA